MQQLTIGAFSRLTHLSVKTLRYYHEVGLLEPAVVDPDSGYRYYRPGQAHSAQLVRRFRDLGLPVADVKAVLAAPDLTARDAILAGHLDRMREVVKRVSSALTAADPGDIAQMSVTTSSASPYGGKTTTTTAEEWSYGDQWRSVTYSSPGHPLYDEGYTASAGSSVYTLVNYPTRTWAKRPGLGRPAAAIPFSTLPAPPRGCGPAIGGPPVALQVRAAGHRAARQFAAVDGGEVPADRGLLRNTGRGRPADASTGSRQSS